ncbi:hypothetical protein ACFST9_00245 [Hymenobacter monticola]|uniref:VCBS repeat-containing protein n=1 Tax=Hymenobacter monticola TaxID=1705399 RepID=A0ABY4BGC8_9BACT|nr:hypothetical protein [Hymenobacter monticola]UOE36808.1 hypothetical protein MTP16_25360 [Hymenobacter monticola]
MKLLLLATLLLPTLALAQAGRPAAPAAKRIMPASALAALLQAFGAHLHQKRDGNREEPAQRKMVYGDVDGDGVPDAVVLYTLEEVRGNGWGQSLAVFLQQKGGYRLVADEAVGGKFFRSFDVVKIVDNEIIGQIRTCPGHEVACDNARKQQVKLVLVGTTLRER